MMQKMYGVVKTPCVVCGKDYARVPQGKGTTTKYFCRPCFYKNTKIIKDKSIPIGNTISGRRASKTWMLKACKKIGETRNVL